MKPVSSSVPSNTDFDVAVIGSGLGGLTAAAFLAKAGKRVLVCEQHDRAGGFGHSWIRKPKIAGRRVQVRFDASVHDVSGAYQDGPVRRLLSLLGIDDIVEWAPVSHEYILPGLSLKIPSNFGLFEDRLVDRFPDDAEVIKNVFLMMKQCHSELRTVSKFTNGIPRPPLNTQEMQRFVDLCPTISRLIAVSYADVLGFRLDPELRKILTLILAYTTAESENASFLNMMPLFSYYIFGGYYPRGGVQKIADALVDIVQKNQGFFLPRCKVEEIIFEKDIISGLKTKRGEFQARHVVSNADIGITASLLPQSLKMRPNVARRLRVFEPSNSASMVYLVLDRKPKLAGSTIIVDDELGGVILSFPPFQEERAPSGLYTLTITSLISAPAAKAWVRQAPEYRRLKAEQGDRMVAVAASHVKNLRESIVFREDGTPATLSRYIGTTNGAAYGSSFTTRWPGSRTPIPGLYFVGASAGLGPGIEAVMISGAALAEELLSKHDGSRGGE